MNFHRQAFVQSWLVVLILLATSTGQYAAAGDLEFSTTNQQTKRNRVAAVEAARGVSRTVSKSKSETLRVYVGTYTGGKSGSKGIYRMQLDLSSGALSKAKLAVESSNPSFVAIHPNEKFLYAVNEDSDFGGKKSGAVSAFAIDPTIGDLKFLNQHPSRGAHPCHLVVDATGKNVLVANYTGGSVASLPIQKDGSLGKASAFIQHAGSSILPRQKSPHAHSINLDAANRFAFVADLGLDRVLVYRFDAAKGSLTANDPPSVSVDPGSGPRHFAFHPNDKFAYVINEITLTVTAFSYNANGGALKSLQTISTLPPGTKGKSLSTAEVRVHPSGKFLYGSNRGHNTIAVFQIDSKTGKLTTAGHQSTEGKTPRNFALDPTGKFLLAENQSTDTIVVFRIDPKTGALKPTGHSVDVPSPVCVRMLPLAGGTD